MANELLIKNGRVCVPGELLDGDVLVSDGRIAAIGRQLDAPGAQVFDAGARW